MVLFLHNVTAFVAMFVSAVNGSFFFSLQFFSPVRCPMHCRVAIPKSEGLTLEFWNFTLTERYGWYNCTITVGQTKFKGFYKDFSRMKLK